MKTIKAKTIALVIAMSASTSVYAFPAISGKKQHKVLVLIQSCSTPLPWLSRPHIEVLT